MARNSATMITQPDPLWVCCGRREVWKSKVCNGLWSLYLNLRLCLLHFTRSYSYIWILIWLCILLLPVLLLTTKDLLSTFLNFTSFHLLSNLGPPPHLWKAGLLFLLHLLSCLGPNCLMMRIHNKKISSINFNLSLGYSCTLFTKNGWDMRHTFLCLMRKFS